MAVTPLLFHSRPVVVEAVQVTLANIEEIASWVGDAVRASHGSTPPDGVRVRPGDWVVRTGTSRVRLCSDDEFRAAYQPVVGS